MDAFRLHCNDPNENIVVAYDVFFHHCLSELRVQLKNSGNIYFLQLRTHDDDKPKDPVKEIHVGGRVIVIPEDCNISDCSLFFIGFEGRTLNNLLMTTTFKTAVLYNPFTAELKAGPELNRVLKKRYYYVEKAKDSKIIGLLVGTLGVANYIHIIERYI